MGRECSRSAPTGKAFPWNRLERSRKSLVAGPQSGRQSRTKRL